MADIPTVPTPGMHEARRRGVAGSIAVEMADTTWRMFVPTIGMLLIGRAIDGRYGMKPWGMLVGIVMGTVIAGMLVRRQLARAGDEK